jgi:hypothetical protein
MIELIPAEIQDSLVIAGHNGFGKEVRESRGGDDGEAGIGTAWIVAAILLAVVTVALLVWVSPSSTKAKLKSAAPGVLIAAIMATPLMVWAATSGGDAQNLIVERARSEDTGAPELIVSLAEDDLNTLDTTNGKRGVRVECLGRGGQVVLEASQRWPFPSERGYDYPHAHQTASPNQLRRAELCRLQGTHVRLEARVEGPELEELERDERGEDAEEGEGD